MSSSKLAIADKQEILRLYCETDLSTAKLSKQFGISPSTTLRLLQEMMSPEAYKEIVQKKQTKSPKSAQKSNKQIKNQSKPIASESITQSTNQVASQLDLELLAAIEETESPKAVVELGRPAAPIRPMPITPLTKEVIKVKEVIKEIIEEAPVEITEEELPSDFSDSDDLEDFDEQKSVVEDLVHDLVHEEDIIDDEFDEDDELDPEDDEFDEDSASGLINPDLNSVANILSILPLEEAELSHICYIVVDKASEIVTRPMRDFKDLGKVPTDEINLQALPVFDNHRSARRFSTPNQKVIKFPSSLIYATRSHLSQKGITRLLYDGQVFSL
ncbi:hypothetical protein Syn7502_00794 [Synechococcus sp. PCC 7502]|uniref:hypothetical protein n=1 Tax=Synechococcus sp. PCC 7502 TaxID=1173263 RepID=UPI00029FF831|nr:hypothetical protein [Synechococcus sp. PCC 7502]AFY72928.1 hypothetical protein Syn7502_00794 [Synechococcus sp. PCC 7502]